MIAPPDLSKLSHAGKDALILTLISQLTTAQQLIASQTARIADLEARLDELTRPPKTPDNSSKPPSQGQKQDRPPPTDRPARKSRPGVGRALEPNPDRVVDARLAACPQCPAVFPATAQTPQQVYDRIELPPIKPDVTQVRLFGGRCACCGERVTAAAPSGLEPGSPFGQSIAALVVYLHYAHAIGLERLAALMGEIFALSISEGAISNMLARAREPLLAAAATIRETVTRQSGGLLRRDLGAGERQELVGMGICRHAGGAARHSPKPWQGRGAGAVRCHSGRRSGCPTCWAASAATRCEWQVCLAHLLRDARYAIECGDTAFSVAFKRLLLRAIAIGRRRDTLKDTTLKQYLADLERRLDRIMAAVPIGRAGTQAAQAHRRQPGASVRVRHQPQRAVHQQRVRTAPASQRDLSQGHQRVPLRVGRRNLRRIPLRRQHRKSQPRIGA